MARRQSLVNRILIVIVLALGALHVLYSGYLLVATNDDQSLHTNWNGLNDFIPGAHEGVIDIKPPPPPPIKIKYVGTC